MHNENCLVWHKTILLKWWTYQTDLVFNVPDWFDPLVIEVQGWNRPHSLHLQYIEGKTHENSTCLALSVYSQVKCMGGTPKQIPTILSMWIFRKHLVGNLNYVNCGYHPPVDLSHHSSDLDPELVVRVAFVDGQPQASRILPQLWLQDVVQPWAKIEKG